MNHFCCFFFFLSLSHFLHLIFTVFKLKHKGFFSPQDRWSMRLKYLFLLVLVECVRLGFRVRLHCLVGLSDQWAPPRPEREAVLWNKTWTFENLPLLSSAPHFHVRLMCVLSERASECQSLLNSWWLQRPHPLTDENTTLFSGEYEIHCTYSTPELYRTELNTQHIEKM